jgi:hypothetical protein
MKSTDNRYRPPRVRYNLDSWTQKAVRTDKNAQFGKQALGLGKKKKGKNK